MQVRNYLGIGVLLVGLTFGCSGKSPVGDWSASIDVPSAVQVDTQNVGRTLAAILKDDTPGVVHITFKVDDNGTFDMRRDGLHVEGTWVAQSNVLEFSPKKVNGVARDVPGYGMSYDPGKDELGLLLIHRDRPPTKVYFKRH